MVESIRQSPEWQRAGPWEPGWGHWPGECGVKNDWQSRWVPGPEMRTTPRAAPPGGEAIAAMVSSVGGSMPGAPIGGGHVRAAGL